MTPSAGERELDFIVIGTQKGGTTSLWQYLRRHPQIAMPDYKEASILCMPEEKIPETIAAFMRTSFACASPEVRLGKVSTHYMGGVARIDVEGIVDRIARTWPSVRLVALLRDPIQRAVSHYRMSVRRGFERRSLDEAVAELLSPERLREGRLRATETNSYLTQGEYGRILSAYRRRFAAERIQVEATADLAADPGAVLDRLLVFLGLPPGYRPEGLGARHHVGGSCPRLDAEGEAQLRAFMTEHIWPRLGEEAPLAGLAFDFFMQTWNVIPDEDLPPLSVENRRRLEEHFAEDARALAAQGIAHPWIERWGWPATGA